MRTALLFLPLALVACSVDEDSPVHQAREEVAAEANELLDAAADLFDAQKAELGARFEGSLAEAEDRIAELKVQAAAAAIEKKPELEAALADLQARRDEARAELERLQGASGEAWAELSEGFRAAADELGAAVSDASDALAPGEEE